jgi:hypothetical protein
MDSAAHHKGQTPKTAAASPDEPAAAEEERIERDFVRLKDHSTISRDVLQ